MRTRTTGHKKEKEIAIHYPKYIEYEEGEKITHTPDFTLSQLKEYLPSKTKGSVTHNGQSIVTEGIPIRVDETEIELQAYYDYYYRPVPAGCQITNYTVGGTCTLGTPAYDNDINEYVLVTAGHCGESGDVIAQPASTTSYTIGDVDVSISNYEFDAATIRRYDGVGYDDSFAKDCSDCYQDYVAGTVGWDEIKDNEGNSSYNLSLQGRTTGRNSGMITEVQTDHVYWIAVGSQGGDSGGPHFKPVSGWNYISGIHAWGRGGDEAGATHIGKVENYYNLSV